MTYIENPSAVGNPNDTPRVYLSPAALAYFNPCSGNAPSRNGYCGGVNGYHLEDCPIAPDSAPRFRADES